MKTKIITVLFSLFLNMSLFAQKIDTDSLLVKTHYEISTTKNYTKAINLARLGIKNAPNYLDFHLALGRTYMLTKQADSSRYFLKYVINKNTKYKEAFIYLTKLEIEQNNSLEAIITVDNAIKIYPDDKDLEILKLQVIYSENNDEKAIEYLELLVAKYPDDTKLKQQLVELKTKTSSDRVGVSYNYTAFSRDNYGPWHLVGLQYTRERKKITLIGHINFVDRRAFGNSIKSGFQYEIEAYNKINNKSYSYADIAVSDGTAFPKLRLAYSYFRNLGNSWEGDLGIRYTKTTDKDLYSGVLGVGKYVGAYWFNLRTYLNFENSKTYPSFTATARYYLDTKYNYLTAFVGYGTSPEERNTIQVFQERLTFNSYRVGAGYYKLFGEHYVTGLQASFNRQEYQLDTFQNEYNLYISLQYKF
ncbi:MAG: YaiO family outer membrane beta-barrel protein [Flavobacterium sp.]|uniref:YaiO family outer membrane beta-barrel protein n=1 Tax=Flavobacterium sp. TaxID=239 RepID=UPI003264868A